MTSPRHPNKHIQRAIEYAVSLGWEVQICSGHSWGKLICPLRSRDGCTIFIHSTPRVPENHARHIQREIDICPHCGGQERNTEEDADDESTAM